MRRTAIIFLFVLFSYTQAKTPSFQPLNMNPQTFFGGYLSGNGSTVVTQYGQVWTSQSGVQNLPCFEDGQSISGISYNGSTILVNDDLNFTPYTWNINTGKTAIPNMNYGFALSKDGHTVGGISYENGETAQVWSDKNGAVPVTDSSGQPAGGPILALSQDGSIAYGYSFNSSSIQAYRWSQNHGLEYLSPFSGPKQTTGFDDIFLADCSADGQLLTGRMKYKTMINGKLTTCNESFQWSDSEGLTSLGFLDSYFYNQSSAVSADGSIVVGTSKFDIGIQDYTAYIWEEEYGLRDLNEVLTEQYHVDLNGWRLHSALDISDDGTTILAFGIGPAYEFDFCLIEIPEPAAVLLLALGGLLTQKHRQ